MAGLAEGSHRSNRESAAAVLAAQPSRHTISAIDMALWDITGKAWGVPVHRLLGGPTRDKIRMYTSPTTYKIGPGGPRPFAASPVEIKGMVDHIAQIRKRLGPSGLIMVDVHSRWFSRGGGIEQVDRNVDQVECSGIDQLPRGGDVVAAGDEADEPCLVAALDPLES